MVARLHNVTPKLSPKNRTTKQINNRKKHLTKLEKSLRYASTIYFVFFSKLSKILETAIHINPMTIEKKTLPEKKNTLFQLPLKHLNPHRYIP